MLHTFERCSGQAIGMMDYCWEFQLQCQAGGGSMLVSSGVETWGLNVSAIYVREVNDPHMG